MAYKEHEVKQMYFFIGEVALFIGQDVSCIRHWCKVFSFDVDKRARNKARRFSREEFRKVLALNWLVKIEQYTHEGAKVKYNLWLQGKFTIPQENLLLPDELSAPGGIQTPNRQV